MTYKSRPDTRQRVRFLLAASEYRVGGSPRFLLPASVAFANLLVCVPFEDSIRGDPTGRWLSAFFLLQAIAIFLLTIAHVMNTIEELLHKSLVMPLTPSVRLAFAMLSPARQPVLLAVVSTDVFFLLVLFHQSAATIVVVSILTVLMAANLIALTSLACAAAIRRSRPPTAVAAYGILGMLGILAITLLFHMPAALGFIPPISWTALGILAIRSGETALALLCGAAGMTLLLLTALLGRRLV